MKLNLFTYFFAILWLVFFSNSIVFAQEEPVFEQSMQILGRVFDDQTEESVPFANVVFKGTGVGTTSDLDGNFSFTVKLPLPADSLVISSIGYKRVSKYVPAVAGVPQTINFRLLRDDYVIEDIVILAGENPADIMMRKVIKNKEKNNAKKQIPYFKYETYNKMELDICDISDGFKSKKIFKPFQFIFDNVDSVSEEKPFLPLFLTESISEMYWHENTNKEVVKASKALGNKNESVAQFLGSMYQQIDIYDPFLSIMGKNFPSPIGNQALYFYKFYLIDSSKIDNKWCYQLKFKPKRAQETAFLGDMWVMDSTFAVRKMGMFVNSKMVNINFIDQLSVYQEYLPINDTLYFLKKDKLVINFKPTKNAPGVIGRRTNSAKNFDFNALVIQKLMNSTLDDIIVEDSIFDKTDDFWQTARHDSLSKSEKMIYKIADTIQKMPIVRTYVDIAALLVSGYKTFGKIDVGPYFTLYSKNQVEGNRFRIGARTNSKMSQRFRVGGYVAYGLQDKAFKYGANGLLMLSRKPWQYLTYTYYNDLDIMSRSAAEFGQDNIFSGVYRLPNIPQKLIRIHNHQFEYHRDWILGFSNKITLTHRELRPYFNTYYFLQNSDNENIIAKNEKVTVSEIKLSSRFAYKEKFVNDKMSRMSLGSKYPVLNLQIGVGLKNVLNSGYNYQKAEFSLYDWFDFAHLGWSEYTLTAGKIWGQLPFILLNNYAGNETYFYNSFAFNKMLEYEFISDTYTTLLWTHHFQGLFFDRVPLLRKLKWRTVGSFKAAAGTLSAQNISFNTDAMQQVAQFDDKIVGWQLQTPTFSKPYMEASVGIENIFKLFRVDAVWRLNYHHRPTDSKVGIRAGMNLAF